MRILKIFLVFNFLLGLSSASYSFTDREIQQEDKKVEIGIKQLPEKVRFHITDHFHGVKILHIYKRLKGKTTIGYLVEVEKDAQKLALNYDQEGKFQNKTILKQ